MIARASSSRRLESQIEVFFRSLKSLSAAQEQGLVTKSEFVHSEHLLMEGLERDLARLRKAHRQQVALRT